MIEFEAINQKVRAKEGRLNRIKQYRQNRTFQNNERKFYEEVGGNATKTYPRLNASEPKQFLSKIWEHRAHNRKTECINDTQNELQGLKGGLKAKIHLDSLRAILKNTKLKNSGP